MSNNQKSYPVPSLLAELEWVWVLAVPITKHRDSLLMIDMDRGDGQQRRIIPIFEERETAMLLKPQLTPGSEEKYAPQAMRLSEVGNFAARNQLEIMLLDGSGHILAYMEAKLEEAYVH